MKEPMKLVAALLTLALATPAMADTITYSARFANRLPSDPLPGFDPALGQLTQVDLDIRGSASGFWYSQNGSLFDAGTFHLLFEAMLGPVFPGYVGGVMTSDPFVLDQPCNGFPWGGVFDMQSTLTGDLERFQTPVLGLSYDCSAWFTDTGTWMLGNLRDIIGTETVTYTFGPSAPEPSSVVMLMAGMVGLGIVRRNKKAQHWAGRLRFRKRLCA